MSMSIGFSQFSEPKQWAKQVLNAVHQAKKKIDASNLSIDPDVKLVVTPKMKSYCASAFYAYNICKWEPQMDTAFFMGICCIGRPLGNDLKGFLRRAFDSIKVTSAIDEHYVLASAHDDLYADCLNLNQNQIPDYNINSFNNSFIKVNGRIRLKQHY